MKSACTLPWLASALKWIFDGQKRKEGDGRITFQSPLREKRIQIFTEPGSLHLSDEMQIKFNDLIRTYTSGFPRGVEHENVFVETLKTHFPRERLQIC